MEYEELKRFISTLKRRASVKKRMYEEAVEKGCDSEYIGTNKGEWLAYSDAAKLLANKLKEKI